MDREADDKASALFWAGLDLDGAVVGFDDALTDAEAESCAFVFGGKEWDEEVFHDSEGDAGAIVIKDQFDVGGFVFVGEVGGDRDVSVVFFDGFEAIADQVDEDLFKFFGVSVDQGDILIEMEGEFALGIGEFGVEELAGAFEDLVDIGQFKAAAHRSCVVEELGDDAI